MTQSVLRISAIALGAAAFVSLSPLRRPRGFVRRAGAFSEPGGARPRDCSDRARCAGAPRGCALAGRAGADAKLGGRAAEPGDG